MRNSLAFLQRLPRDVRLYIAAWGCVGFGYFGIVGVLFNLYLVRLGYGPETIGLLVGGGQLAWGLSAIPAGLIGGRVGNRNAMIMGMTILAITHRKSLIGPDDQVIVLEGTSAPETESEHEDASTGQDRL